MDPYDMPEQLSVLQAYDMSKIGFLQDLVRGVNKVLGGGKEPEHARETLVVQGKEGSSLTALLRRGELSLEDGEWKAADEFFDRVLDMDAGVRRGLRGKFLAGAQQKSLWPDYTAARIEQARSENQHAAEAVKQTKRTLRRDGDSLLSRLRYKTAVKRLVCTAPEIRVRGRILACGGARRTGAAGKRPQFEKSQGICRGCVQENPGR